MAHNKVKVSVALKKVGSLVAKIQKMVDGDAYCIDVIQQVLASMGLLRSVNAALLEGHMEHCVRTAMRSKDEKKQEEVIAELVKVMNIAQKK